MGTTGTNLNLFATIGLCFVVSCFCSVRFSVSDSIPHRKSMHPEGKLQQLEELDNSNSECVQLNAMDMCQGRDGEIRMARFPNLMGHSNEEQSVKSLKKFQPIFDSSRKSSSPSSCGSKLRKFICPLYAAECTPGGVEVVQLPPCRLVCLEALAECLGMIKRIGVNWPQEWNCESLPEDGLCLNISLSSLHVTREPDVEHHVIQWPPSGGSLMPPPSSDQSNTRRFNNNKHLLRNNEISRFKHKLSDRSDKYQVRQMKKEQKENSGSLFHGWVDVQGQGSANDYCRVIGMSSRNRFLSCSLNGNHTHAQTYISKRGFDVGHRKTWYMKDMDGDGRDDYCRCVGRGHKVTEVCMKAGSRGFYGSRLQPGSEYSFKVLKPASKSICMT